jgi:hypothetical protein
MRIGPLTILCSLFIYPSLTQTADTLFSSAVLSRLSPLSCITNAALIYSFYNTVAAAINYEYDNEQLQDEYVDNAVRSLIVALVLATGAHIVEGTHNPTIDEGFLIYCDTLTTTGLLYGLYNLCNFVLKSKQAPQSFKYAMGSLGSFFVAAGGYTGASFMNGSLQTFLKNIRVGLHFRIDVLKVFSQLFNTIKVV